ncbi:thiopurine S-methyltransferase [Neptuniibacter sp. SY11_33]|uniref:thiopurine S-methyltransferase n=1 Tax=Neptuniibacter sp. SY11_33 TaxID=3398215 RepID=UPI0039F56471
MEHDFWHQKWSEGRIGFHQPEVNAYLVSYWERLCLAGGDKVFVPLCGKSKDMLWLRDRGHDVLGVELNPSACLDFFAESGLVAETGDAVKFISHRCENLNLICGDFFALSKESLADVKGVYDRAALVALPKDMRADYANKLIELLPKGVKILLVTLEFDRPQGPPFSVSGEEVNSLFEPRFKVKRLGGAVDGDRQEVVWLLSD